MGEPQSGFTGARAISKESTGHKLQPVKWRWCARSLHCTVGEQRSVKTCTREMRAVLIGWSSICAETRARGVKITPKWSAWMGEGVMVARCDPYLRRAWRCFRAVWSEKNSNRVLHWLPNFLFRRVHNEDDISCSTYSHRVPSAM